MQLFKTVLGDIQENEVGSTLVHEHICCYSEYLYQMSGKSYLDKEQLVSISSRYLTELKGKYGLNTFIDCTPVNIGRDIDLLKAVSKKAGVHIISSTGFYYTQEPLLYNTPIDLLTEHIVADAKNTNAGIIKCAVENELISAFDEKVLRAAAKAQLKLQLPVILHTHANNKNGLQALAVLLSEGVKPQAITVGHLSDTDDLEYIKQIAEHGCYIGFDRLYCNKSEQYISNTVDKIISLCGFGYANQLLLSHDALFFNGFETEPEINKTPRFSFVFDCILPLLPNNTAELLIKHNPIAMLKCGE